MFFSNGNLSEDWVNQPCLPIFSAEKARVSLADRLVCHPYTSIYFPKINVDGGHGQREGH